MSDEALRRQWLGHRDWCPRQWAWGPCDCPCSFIGCPGIKACKDPECPVAAYLPKAEDSDD